jgi:hypothetical protein
VRWSEEQLEPSAWYPGLQRRSWNKHTYIKNSSNELSIIQYNRLCALFGPAALAAHWPRLPEQAPGMLNMPGGCLGLGVFPLFMGAGSVILTIVWGACVYQKVQLQHFSSFGNWSKQEQSLKRRGVRTYIWEFFFTGLVGTGTFAMHFIQVSNIFELYRQ